jgi:hypothetical protein
MYLKDWQCLFVIVTITALAVGFHFLWRAAQVKPLPEQPNVRLAPTPEGWVE